MRIAELLMSVALAALALAVMYKAGERPSWSGEARFSNVGFGESGSPAGGFWPFWVAAIMFLCCVWTFINGILRRTKPSQTEGPFLDRHGVMVLLTVGLPVFFLVLLTDYISMYFSMAVFLFYYLFVLGRHGVLLSSAMAFVFPFWLYLFFDITMTRTLPKGTLAVEDAIFTPLGNWFRQADSWVTGVFFLAGALVIVLAAVASSRRKGDA